MVKWFLIVMLSVLVMVANASVQEQPACTITVQPGQSIQEAIDGAPEGAVICVSAANFPYMEHLTITKSLTLRGAGREKTFLTGKEENKPVVYINSNEEIMVVLEELTIAVTLPIGFHIEGKARANLRILDIRGRGAYYNIAAGGSTHLSLENSRVYNGGIGLLATGSAQVIITNSQLFNNGNGIYAGREAQVSLMNSSVFDNRANGLDLRDSATVELKEARVIDNKHCGVAVWSEQAQVQGKAQELRGNGADLCGYAPASLRKPLVPQTPKVQLTVPRDYASLQEAIDAIAPGGTIIIAAGTYEAGLTIWKPLTLQGAGREQTILKASPDRGLVGSITAQGYGVHLEGLTLAGGIYEGLLVYGRGSFINVQIMNNGFYGLLAGGSAIVEVQDGFILNNGMDPECSHSGELCNGVGLWDQAQITLSNSMIKENGDWGIGAALKQCGYPRDAFTGSAIFEGTNIIEGNNRWGNQKGLGNPGNHPWNNPSVLDGQVCLP